MSTRGAAEAIAFIEIPAGSRNKYEYDPELDAIILDRRLFTSMSYPADYGFIEDTLAPDGDPLDALVIAGDPTFPGCRVRVRPIGLFRMTDEKGQDEKLVCVSTRDPQWSEVKDIGDLHVSFREEVEHFFQVYKDLEGGKHTETFGFAGREEAEAVLARSRKAA